MSSGTDFLAYAKTTQGHLVAPSLPTSKKIEQSTDKAFAAFLKAKVEGNGNFSVKEILKYRRMQIIHAVKSLWNKDANLASPQNLILRKRDFDHKCGVVQVCYKKCMTTGSSMDDVAALKKAYEDVLALANGNSDQHDQINEILDKKCGRDASVGRVLLTYRASIDLQDGIAIDANDLLNRIQKAYTTGYRGSSTPLEVKAAAEYARFDHRLVEIKNVLQDKSKIGLFLPYARVYEKERKMRRANGQKKLELAFTPTRPANSNSEDRTNEIRANSEAVLAITRFLKPLRPKK